MPDIKFLKTVVFVNALVPAALLGWDAYHMRLGANPLEFLTRTTGALTLIFLLISLSVTPIRKGLGVPWLVKFRRMTGLFAFFYGCLHLLTYVWFTQGFAIKAILRDIGKRPFIMLMHGDREVSTKALARIMNVKRTTPCTPEIAQKHSGYMVGGTSPFGTRKLMPVYMEETILNLPIVYINGGKRGYLVGIDPRELMRVLNPILVNLAI